MPTLNIDQTDVAEKVYDVVEALVSSSSLDLVCEYEYLPATSSELPCVTMQTLTGTPVEREYLDGAYIANYRFALYLRMEAADTASRLSGRKVLDALAKEFAVAKLDFGESYDIWEQRIDTLPCRIAAEEAWADYQVTLTIKYKSHR